MAQYIQQIAEPTAFWNDLELGIMTNVMLLKKTNVLELGTVSYNQAKYS
jgi:hypothetical protein